MYYFLVERDEHLYLPLGAVGFTNVQYFPKLPSRQTHI